MPNPTGINQYTGGGRVNPVGGRMTSGVSASDHALAQSAENKIAANAATRRAGGTPTGRNPVGANNTHGVTMREHAASLRVTSRVSSNFARSGGADPHANNPSGKVR